MDRFLLKLVVVDRRVRHKIIFLSKTTSPRVFGMSSSIHVPLPNVFRIITFGSKIAPPRGPQALYKET